MPLIQPGPIAGGLLRQMQEQKVQAPTSVAAFRPAEAALVQEPLTKVPPPGTSQILSEKPPLDWETLENTLASMPPPTPEVAARLIAAMVSEPQPGTPEAAARGRVVAAQSWSPTSRFYGVGRSVAPMGPISGLPQLWQGIKNYLTPAIKSPGFLAKPGRRV